MSRQYFQDVIIDPPIVNLSAVTAITETGLWNVAQFTPIHAFDAYKGAGKIYKLTAGGVFSTSGSASTLTITPRIGTTTSGVTLGASIAQTVPISLSNEPWTMEFNLVIRSVGAPGANTSCTGTGTFTGGGIAGTAGSNTTVTFGGTPATADFSIETGIFIGWTLSVAGSCTPQYVFIQSLN